MIEVASGAVSDQGYLVSIPEISMSGQYPHQHHSDTETSRCVLSLA